MSSTEKRSKQTKSSSFHKGKLILFLLGCTLGAACFLWIYGARVLNPVYDGWLFGGDIDLAQHYIGFCHYRLSPWRFPLGMTDTLSYPSAMSVIYTDSIPLFAFIFKLFKGILPLRFQYFGIFGLMSFMLTGGLSSLLVFNLISRDKDISDPVSDTGFPFINANLNYIISLTASLIYILSFTVLQRMFYHTALGAQWILILALYIWTVRGSLSKVRVFTLYCLMGFLCVGIHSYFIPMTGLILLGASVETLTVRKDSSFKEELMNLAGFCAFGLLTLFVFGAFSGPSNGYEEGFGTFTSNLNTFIDPLYGSILIKPMKLYYDFQYEGYSYLGIGMFLLIAAAAYYLIREMHREGFKRYLRSHIRVTLFLVIIILGFMLAVLPTVAFCGSRIVSLPIPGVLKKAAGIFRSNGRFIWVPEYLIFTGALVFSCRLLKEQFLKSEKGKSIMLKLLICAVLIQVLDATAVISDKQGYFKHEQSHKNRWGTFLMPGIKEAGDDFPDGYDEFVFLFNDHELGIIMDTAYYAYLNGMKLNNYYYARNIDDAINEDIAGWLEKIGEDRTGDDIVYICLNEDLKNGIRTEDGRTISLADADIDWYELDKDHMAGVKKR
ncbi:MAG: DUF6311 domain-containing protein [Lachnospiraceae bacterium]|nr:DUF6311 domain-containing protein [Lachnospiraceae bacterium]